VALVVTDVMVDILRQHPPAVAWLASLGEEPIQIPGFVAMELIQGCSSLKEQRNVERILRPSTLVWPKPEEYNSAFAVYYRFHLSHSLGLLDALIAQVAISLSVPLCTFNIKHYAAVPGLTINQPYSR
jgi:predicted nucleic acid-binding protein